MLNLVFRHNRRFQTAALWIGSYNWCFWNHINILGWGHGYHSSAENVTLKCEVCFLCYCANHLVQLDCSGSLTHSAVCACYFLANRAQVYF